MKKDENMRLFVDMDGTLATFNKDIERIEELTEPGYFKNLEPMQNVVEGINNIVDNHKDIQVFILSCYLTDQSILEKNAWLDKYLPGIPKENRLFLPDGQDKAKYLKESKGMSKTDFLLDDYNKNLHSWREAGGNAIKLINGINDRHRSWNGERVDANLDCQLISYTIINKMISPLSQALGIKKTSEIAKQLFNSKRKGNDVKGKAKDIMRNKTYGR